MYYESKNCKYWLVNWQLWRQWWCRGEKI